VANQSSPDSENIFAETKTSDNYLVLARKYRPQNFAELRGQDALVRTLTNAIQSGRIAHAFMLTGVRGVGKTTTARIIARALNCANGPTITPCGVCDQCKAISEDRHIDVLEMDAASRTGVDDIREIIDSVQYSPVNGRYKIFIIDEVHMLSKNAFNALLKTLEEPPKDVKFIFATTEIRKVPITVLSRCQRFDLRRIGADVLEKYFHELLVRENVGAEDDAVAMIARAADGSARDGLSLLDQAISREPQTITALQVREMLGLVDRSVTFDLYEAIMRGDSSTSMSVLDTLYKDGADAQIVLQDLLDLTHHLTKIKVTPELSNDMALPESERVRGAALIQTLSTPTLTRTWQILLKGFGEVQHAFNPQLALEMLIIRLLYVADQPMPADVLKQLKDGSIVSMGGGAALANTAPSPSATRNELSEQPTSFLEAVTLFGQKRDVLLQKQIMDNVHLVKFEQGHIALRLKTGAPQSLVSQMSDKLAQWTGQRWVISLEREGGEPTLSETALIQKTAAANEVQAHPLVTEILKTFTGAKIVDIREKNIPLTATAK
jgi:DNA polymerase-3 subunit gamma/tau